MLYLKQNNYLSFDTFKKSIFGMRQKFVQYLARLQYKLQELYFFLFLSRPLVPQTPPLSATNVGCGSDNYPVYYIDRWLIRPRTLLEFTTPAISAAGVGVSAG